MMDVGNVKGTCFAFLRFRCKVILIQVVYYAFVLLVTLYSPNELFIIVLAIVSCHPENCSVFFSLTIWFSHFEHLIVSVLFFTWPVFNTAASDTLKFKKNVNKIKMTAHMSVRTLILKPATGEMLFFHEYFNTLKVHICSFDHANLWMCTNVTCVDYQSQLYWY